MIIHIYVIVFCIYHCQVKKFQDFVTFLTLNNWPILLNEVEKEYLASEKFASLY